MKSTVQPKIYMFCALLLMPQAHSTNIRLQIEGISGDLQRNVYACLSTININEITTGAHLQNLVDNAVREGMQALGYYSPTINFISKSKVNSNRNTLIVRITPGKPVKIADVNVILHGEAQQDSDYQQWISDGKLAINTILNHEAYDRFKNGFSSLALHKGYFDAEFRKSQLGVALSRYQAYWDIDFDSGQRYRFGKIYFYGAKIREDYLQNIAKIREGELYNAELLTELNCRLSATNWFNSVVISPNFISGKQNKILPLDAIVTPCSRNNLETGIGYATDTRLRVKTTWNKPWFNSRGHSLQTSFSLSTSKQLANVSYKIPLLKDPLEQYYLLQGYFKYEDFSDTQAESTTLNIARYWDLSNGWQRAVNLHCSLNHFTQGNISDNTMLLYPGININRTRQYGGPMPIWGDSQHYSLDISNIFWGSDIDFIILQAQNIWIRIIAKKHRLVARGNLGWIETNNFKRVPSLLRFFAGGDRNIRGYKYKSLSPRDDKGKLAGASKLITSSLEYQYNVTNKWWGAVFIDCGEAVNNIKQNKFKTGAGIGVRWQSPVGPIKLDIATPVVYQNKHKIQLYVGLGPEL